MNLKKYRMNPVQFWKDVAKKFNEESKCGFCWTFGGALSEDAIETYRIREESKCCVHFFLSDVSWQNIKEYDQLTGLVINDFCDINFTLWALYPSQLGINNYNEIPNHSTDESAWETIHDPLMNCLGCNDMEYVCEILGYPVRIERWYSTMVFKKFSNNFDGWRIEGQFRVIK